MQIRVPEAARAGSTVTLACDYDLEQAALYTIKWYRGDEEFYRFVPKESPPSRVFPMPAVNVDVSQYIPLILLVISVYSFIISSKLLNNIVALKYEFATPFKEMNT